MKKTPAKKVVKTPVKKAPMKQTVKEVKTAKKLAKQRKVIAAADAAVKPVKKTSQPSTARRKTPDALPAVVRVKKAVAKPMRVITPDCACGHDDSYHKNGTGKCAACDECRAYVAAAEAAPMKPTDAPRIECRLIIGDLSLMVDGSNLERTLGAGRWVRESLVDSWPDTAWTGLLAYLGLPSFPLDRPTASPPVKRLVQKLWYEAIKGGVPEERKAEFEARDTAKAAEYKKNIVGYAEAVTGKAERARAAFGTARAKGGETVYEPTAALKVKGFKLGGQAGVLVDAFRANGFKAMTTQEATDAMLKAGLKTGTDPKRISSFYLSVWASKKGLLTRVTK
jgi:hypothetical protein